MSNDIEDIDNDLFTTVDAGSRNQPLENRRHGKVENCFVYYSFYIRIIITENVFSIPFRLVFLL